MILSKELLNTINIVDRERHLLSKYNVYYLIYYEEHPYINNAIAREKEIKSYSRKRKIEFDCEHESAMGIFK